MRAKDKPFAVLDTHAGCGIYDLADERALKTGEAEGGIRKIWGLAKMGTPCLAIYLDIVAQMNAGAQTLRYYPGSPLIARKMMRAGDRLMACELHPEDSHELRRLDAMPPIPLFCDWPFMILAPFLRASYRKCLLKTKPANMVN